MNERRPEFWKPWYPIESDGPQQAAMETELARELRPGHVLLGRAAKAVARRQDIGDVLYLIDDLWVIVHLLWDDADEILAMPGYGPSESPSAILFTSVDDLQGRIDFDRWQFGAD